MKPRIIALAIALISILFPRSSKADRQWSGMQTNTTVFTQLPIYKLVSLQGFGAVFWIPSTGTTLAFVEAGPAVDWLPNGKLWSSFKVGVVAKWMEDGSDGLILSFASGGHIWDKRLSAFVLVEGYIGRSQQDVYGFYKADYNPLIDRLNVGVQAEHVNGDSFQGGPHIGTTVGPLHFEAQYFINPPSQSQTMRWVTMFYF